jgi:hypothetical protein
MPWTILEQARQLAASLSIEDRVELRNENVPPQSAQVRHELERAGFVHLPEIPHPHTSFMVMRLAE